ncbi:unnamed protein product [Rotaria socialis]|uniref:Uncharacterized protein n=1 Tax=Rotaria socialis TaxID=392032 RepID=A0A818KEM5_9BILA|nr:unnamed protein product [Rotaria socialis]
MVHERVHHFINRNGSISFVHNNEAEEEIYIIQSSQVRAIYRKSNLIEASGGETAISNNEELTYIKNISAASYLKTVQSPRVLSYMQIALISIYLVEYAVVLVKAYPYIEGSFNGIFYHEETEKNLKKFLLHINEEQNYCYYCVSNYTTFAKLRELVDKQDRNILYLERLRIVRICFNVVNVTNLVIVYMMFGGPKTIAIATMLSAVLTFATLYVEHKRNQIICDSFIVIIFSIIIGKCIYTLNCIRDKLIIASSTREQ